MSRDRRNPARHGPPPGLTEEERRDWWEWQRRKWVWEPGDVKITKKGNGKRQDRDEEGASPGR